MNYDESIVCMWEYDTLIVVLLLHHADASRRTIATPELNFKNCLFGVI